MNCTKQSQSSGTGLHRYINTGINKSNEGVQSNEGNKKQGKLVTPFDNRIQKSPVETSSSCQQFLDEGDMALLTSLEIEQAVRKMLD